MPVGAVSTIRALARSVERVVALQEPRRFLAVGYWYENFQPTDDDEVRRLLGAV